VWVQLKSVKHIERQGKLRTYHPGEWVDVGKQTALRWIAEGSAWVPEGQAANLMQDDCGVFVWGDPARGEQALGDYVGKIATQAGDWPALPWSKTMIYNPAQRLRKELVPVGFHLLDTWQVAIPLFDYDKLAIHLGDEAERARTQAVVHDLRVPLYTDALLFVRRCGDTERLLEIWRVEHVAGGDPRFSLLRALYQVKPLLLALPVTWLWKAMGDLKSG
jgi:hypothetical protein